MKGNGSIAINATFMHDNPTGLGVYTYELVQELLRIKRNVVVYSSSINLKRQNPDMVSLVTSRTSPSLGFKGHLVRLIWQQTALPNNLKRRGITLLHSTVPEGMLYPSMKQIITVHDIIPARYPELHPKMKYYYYHALPIILKNSSAVVCVSENTRRDVVEYYRLTDKPIYVINEGFNGHTFYPRRMGHAQKPYGLTNYLLYVGDMRPYKNLERALEAFARLNLKDVKFVIGGKKDPKFYPRIEKKTIELYLKDRVLFSGYVPDADLPRLYSESKALVFPSLYEGFGLPPLEAMACACPVVASNVASLPEVCGDAAYYVDPYNVESIAEGMYKVLNDEALRQRMIQKGLERAKLFSWEKSANEHLKVFEEVLAS
jgi:glycosyltransferase involved in cell wall biosynthesis